MFWYICFEMKGILLFLLIVFCVQINAQTPNDTTIKDSTIVKMKLPNNMCNKSSKKDTDSSRVWTMRGKYISYNEITHRLLLFKSSALMYDKSTRGAKFGAVSTIVGILAFGIYGLMNDYTPPPTMTNASKVTGSVAIVGLATGLSTLLIYAIKQHYQFKKAIKLYNQEVIKQNNP